MLRVEMLHEHEPKPGIKREVFQQLGERLQAASGSADPDDGEAGGVAGLGGFGGA